MAKTKESKDTAIDTTNIVSSLIKELEKEYGSNVIKSAKNILDTKRIILKVSPNLDVPLGGGIPSGSTVIISGPEKIGKTTLVLAICAEAQKHGMMVFYHDVERRIKEMNLCGVEGLSLDPEKFMVISSEQGHILTGEQHLSMAEKELKSIPNCVVILDSSSALCAESEMIADITGQGRNLGPKLFANFCRRVGNVIPVNNCIFIVIQHLINDTSGMGRGKMEDGGVKLQYQQDIKIRGLYKENWKVGSGENEKIVGQLVHWKVITAALPGNTPNTEVDTYLRYGIGIDKKKEYIQLATDLGVILKGGAWYTYGDIKVQGEEKLYQLLVEDQALNDKLLADIQAIIG
jgi:recombination protein RecA